MKRGVQGRPAVGGELREPAEVEAVRLRPCQPIEPHPDHVARIGLDPIPHLPREIDDSNSDVPSPPWSPILPERRPLLKAPLAEMSESEAPVGSAPPFSGRGSPPSPSLHLGLQ